ncbi:DNA translocase FtsK [Helicobacter labetoulli]|uniref:DNA translocase FtsK n=1 Tax=Helicobacter labetoulli TaxID=2315333 RepID=UPI000EF68942|nr:DNA translocase FtsK [Helicobacter labetoulli]
MLIFLSVATLIGDYGLVGDFGTSFAALNIGIFGYVAYIFLPFLLYPLFCLYKSHHITFRRLELIVSFSLFFIALLIFQSLVLKQGSFGNSLVLFLKDYIGYFGLWVLDIFLFLFSWLISTQRNIDLLLKQLKHKLFVAYDFIKLVLSIIYTRTKAFIKRFSTAIKPKIQNLFAKKTQDILDLQNAKQEMTTQAHYDFKDVFIDKAFDEMPQPQSSTHTAQDSHTPQDLQPQTPQHFPNQQILSQPQNLQGTDSNATHQAHTPQMTFAHPPLNPAQKSPHQSAKQTQPPHLEVVPRSQDDLKLEEFLRIQAEKYRNTFSKNVQHTALSDPAIKPRQDSIQLVAQQNLSQPSISQPSTDIQPLLADSTTPQAKQDLESKPNENAPKEIPTPPSRPLNPNVFLQPKEVKNQETALANPTLQQEIQANSTHTQNTQNLNIQESMQESLMQSRQILQDKQIQTSQPLQESVQLDSDKTQLESQQPSLLSNIPQPSPYTDLAHLAPTSPAPQNIAPNPQEFLQSPQTPKMLDLEIQEITPNYNTTNNANWADSIVQEIIPESPKTPAQSHTSQAQHSPQNTPNTSFSTPKDSKPLYQRVTELDENKALLSNLDYGNVAKPLHFKLPTTSLLNQPLSEKTEIDESEIDRKIEDLLAKLRTFRVEGDIARTYSGPIVTTFEFRPAPGIKVSKILTLEDDLAMALRARSIRIQAPIPGKDVVGIEIPNNSTQTIYLREVLESDLFKTSTSPLTLALGKDIVGNPFITDLKRLPHLLIAGTTGSGKSVGLNAMILSLLYKNSPDNLKLLMIDPKKVEFSIYANIPHLITPIITQPKKAIVGLNSAVAEMDRRYDLMSELRTKDIDSYNRKAQVEGMEKFPYLVIIIDELADLMMTGGKEVEFALARIAQMGRASGIHIIVATQRPSVDVVTGLIKTNLPSRISYKVGSKIDSKVILDTFGAESLLGKGDMLFTPPGVGGVTRLHAPWNTEEEIEKVAEFIKSQQEVAYDKNFMLDEKDNLASENLSESGENNDLITEAKKIILQDKKTSASYLQRRLNIGYNKAANLVEQLERDGFLSAPNVKGVREILGS